MNKKKYTDGSTYYSRNRDKALSVSKKWYWKNRGRLIIEKRKKRGSLNPLVPRRRSRGHAIFPVDQESKNKVLSHYGNFCKCCGESNSKLLTLDHINDNGREHGTARGRYKGTTLYRFLISRNYPDGIQTLCFNCNIGRRNNGGICPHATLKDDGQNASGKNNHHRENQKCKWLGSEENYY